MQCNIDYFTFSGAILFGGETWQKLLNVGARGKVMERSVYSTVVAKCILLRVQVNYLLF